MKSRIRHSSPLKLNRETLRVLSATELSGVAGGSFQQRTLLEISFNPEDCLNVNPGGNVSHPYLSCTGHFGNSDVILPGPVRIVLGP